MILSSFLLTYVVCYFNFNPEPWQLGSLKLEWALSSLTGEREKTGLLEKKTGFLLQGPEYYHLLSGGGFATPHGLLPPSLSPPSLWHQPLIIPPLQTRPALRLTSRSVLFTEQCSHLIEGCQNPESGFLSISKSCKFYFKNTSPTPHFYFQCHPLLTVSCLYYISSLLSFFQALSLLSQQPILHTAAGGLIKLLI